MRRSFACIITFLLFLSALTCFAQQTYVSRYDAFSGYSFLSTPKMNLFENGFNQQFGINVRTWLALGGDFSVFNGSTTLTTNQLNPTLVNGLIEKYGQYFPPGYKLQSPYGATTYTFAAGPQFNIRKLKGITFFVRPGLGGLHQSVSLHPTDPLTTKIVAGLLGTSMSKSDTVLFYGFGGGMDFNASKHVAFRVAADFVHYDVFSNLLNGGENTVRFSVGPSFRFGENIVRK